MGNCTGAAQHLTPPPLFCSVLFSHTNVESLRFEKTQTHGCIGIRHHPSAEGGLHADLWLLETKSTESVAQRCQNTVVAQFQRETPHEQQAARGRRRGWRGWGRHGGRHQRARFAPGLRNETGDGTHCAQLHLHAGGGIEIDCLGTLGGVCVWEMCGCVGVFEVFCGDVLFGCCLVVLTFVVWFVVVWSVVVWFVWCSRDHI